VVVPSFNQATFLRQALDSIFEQRYPHLEVVVMDGGSTDGSVEVIRTYEVLLKHWRSAADEGQAAAINEGVRHCTGEVVAWLNSDDFYCGDALWTVGRAYAAHPGFGLYIGNGLRHDQESGRFVPFCRRHVVLNRRALIDGLDYILQPSTFFLRRAWEECGGLDTHLRFCLDWDVIMRIAARHRAVLINDFLAASREHDETKTRQGGIARATEILRLARAHSGHEITPGGLFYLFETVLHATSGAAAWAPARYHLSESMRSIQRFFAGEYGNADGFPETGDPQDKVYLPLAAPLPSKARAAASSAPLPSISIVTASLDQAAFLGQALDSILNQQYPRVETLVFDGGSEDGSVEILRAYGDRLGHWVSEPDRGPAHAINKGLSMAKGEILSWLNSDDMLARDALWEVGRSFAEDPELDMVLGNALYIDEENRLHLADHGTHRTGLYYGEMQLFERIPQYWTYVHSVPQPTVFFRRRLLDTFGYLDESYHFIFDFELFWRFAEKARVKKIERTLAFYRIHASSKTSDWNKFLVELYRFSRPLWPRLGSAEFARTLQSFLSRYMARRFGPRPRDWKFWTITGLVGLCAVTRIVNPEALSFRSLLSPAGTPGRRGVEPPPVGAPEATNTTAGFQAPRRP
jgi:glycosyltransferase involved in cell wall biosynthesis